MVDLLVGLAKRACPRLNPPGGLSTGPRHEIGKCQGGRLVLGERTMNDSVRLEEYDAHSSRHRGASAKSRAVD